MRIQPLLIASGFAMWIPSHLAASGFDRTPINDDALLFDPSTFAAAFSLTHVIPDRGYSDGSGIPGVVTTDANPTFQFGSLGFKHAFGDATDCLFKLHTPWGNHTETELSWAAGNNLIRNEISSLGGELLCSQSFALSEQSTFRLFGGPRLQSFSFERDIVYVPGLDAATFELSSDRPGLGWKAGLSYEVPEIALRATLTYRSAIGFDLEGHVSDLFDPVSMTVIPSLAISSKVDTPQSLELYVQSGVAPDWLVFGGVKWTDWDVIDRLEVPETGASIVTGYKDSLDATFGVVHQMSEDLRLMGSLFWTEGMGGGYTDELTLGLGGDYQVNEATSVQIGAAYTFISGDSYSDTALNGLPFSYELGDDSALSLSLGLKVAY